MGNRLLKLKEEMSSIHLRPGSRNGKKLEEEKATNSSEANAKPSSNATTTNTCTDPGQKQVRLISIMVN